MILYGKKYDLFNFEDKHPGGKRVFELIQQGQDITTMVESYHAFSEATCGKVLQNYQVEKSFKSTSSEKDIFYSVCKDRVYRRITQDGLPMYWTNMYICIQLSLVVVSCCLLFVDNFVASFLAGTIVVFPLIGTVHGAGHYHAFKNTFLNETCYFVSNFLLMWFPLNAWRVTHNLFHHVYTGSSLDPDISNYGIALHQESVVVPYIARIPVIFLLIGIFIFPGQYLGLSIEFLLACIGIASPRKHCRSYFRFMSTCLFFPFGFYIMCQFVDFLKIVTFVMGLNFMFAVIVTPDHDTKVTRNNSEQVKDASWGIRQVNESANYCIGNQWLTILCGGINLQIEHHLFPRLPPYTLFQIAPIIQQTCVEFGVPYTCFPSYYLAFLSFVNNLSSVCSTP